MKSYIHQPPSIHGKHRRRTSSKPENPLTMPRFVCSMVDAIYGIALSTTRMKAPKLDFADFIVRLDLAGYVAPGDTAQLAKLGRLRRSGLTIMVYTWTRIVAILSWTDAQYDALARSAKDAIRVRMLLQESCVILERVIQVQKAAPGLWISSQRGNDAVLTQLRDLSNSRCVLPATKRQNNEWRRVAELLILSGCKVCLLGYADPPKKTDRLAKAIIRRFLGNPSTLPDTVVWQIVRAAEYAADLHPTALATLAQKRRRGEIPSVRNLSTLIAEHMHKHFIGLIAAKVSAGTS